MNEQRVEITKGEIVYDPHSGRVGRFVEMRHTPVFKDHLAVLELSDGSTVFTATEKLQNATETQRQIYYRDKGVHALQDESDVNAAEEDNISSSAISSHHVQDSQPGV